MTNEMRFDAFDQQLGELAGTVETHVKDHDWCEVIERMEMINDLASQLKALARKDPWGADSASGSTIVKRNVVTKDAIASVLATVNDLTEDFLATVQAFKIKLGAYEY